MSREDSLPRSSARSPSGGLEELAVVDAAVQGAVRLGDERRRVHGVPENLSGAQ